MSRQKPTKEDIAIFLENKAIKEYNNGGANSLKRAQDLTSDAAIIEASQLTLFNSVSLSKMGVKSTGAVADYIAGFSGRSPKRDSAGFNDDLAKCFSEEAEKVGRTASPAAKGAYKLSRAIIATWPKEIKLLSDLSEVKGFGSVSNNILKKCLGEKSSAHTSSARVRDSPRPSLGPDPGAKSKQEVYDFLMSIVDGLENRNYPEARDSLTKQASQFLEAEGGIISSLARAHVSQGTLDIVADFIDNNRVSDWVKGFIDDGKRRVPSKGAKQLPKYETEEGEEIEYWAIPGLSEAAKRAYDGVTSYSEILQIIVPDEDFALAYWGKGLIKEVTDDDLDDFRKTVDVLGGGGRYKASMSDDGTFITTEGVAVTPLLELCNRHTVPSSDGNLQWIFQSTPTSKAIFVVFRDAIIA